MASTELRVVDPESGSDLGPGQRGELWWRGPQVTRGYRGLPEATRAMVTADGWPRTGDLGSVDADGDVHVHERIKELIKVDVLTGRPAELEALLITHLEVADRPAAHPASGRRTRRGAGRRCYVSPGSAGAGRLIDWVGERICPYKRIRDVRFMDDSFRARPPASCCCSPPRLSSPAGSQQPQAIFSSASEPSIGARQVGDPLDRLRVGAEPDADVAGT